MSKRGGRHDAGHAGHVSRRSERRREGVAARAAARREVAKTLTAETLQQLRRPPSIETMCSQMQTLFDAGILACPISGMPVFDTTNAPPSLWTFHLNMASALNKPSAETIAAAKASCAKLNAELAAFSSD